MPQALSFDLRSRVLAAIDAGLSCRQAAARFGVSASSATRWQEMRRLGGRPAQAAGRGSALASNRGPCRSDPRGPGPGARHHPARVEGVLGRARGLVSVSALWRFCRRHQITRKKKTAHAAEQDRPDIRRRREAWFEGQLDLDPERLIFIDETWASPTWPGVWAGPARAAAAGWRAARALEDNHLRGRATPERCGGALRAGRPNQPRGVRDLC